MIFRDTELAGVLLIEPERRADERGHFARTWCRREFEARGLNPNLVQCNISFNRHAGTLRGMHYQLAPHAEAKVVRCSRGAMYDVVIDLRSGSPTHGRWLAAELTADNQRMLYVPEGMAHGFQTLADESEVFYQMSDFHAPESAARRALGRPGVCDPLARSVEADHQPKGFFLPVVAGRSGRVNGDPSQETKTGMITILGASGFIGSHLSAELSRRGEPHFCPGRADDLTGRPLGTVFYCAGLTADFRWRPQETVDAHVCKLLSVLRTCRFESIVYLSSTRLYKPTGETAAEDRPIQANPRDPGDLFNLSKALGESLLLASAVDAQIVRLANVYGRDFHSPNFLSAVLREAVLNHKVVLQTSLDSCKDYIRIEDAVALLLRIASEGKERLYNLASGVNVTHRELLEVIQDITGCAVEIIPDAPTVKFPPISTKLIRNEFGIVPTRILDDLPEIARAYQVYFRTANTKCRVAATR